MLFKLALGNVKRSLRDYFIYFLTLGLSICIFYSFNSIESQQAMFKLSSSQLSMLEGLTYAMNYISVLVSIILGFLIVYANNFLIRRRKKELGIYLVLGMYKSDVSKILLYETLIIGVLSIISGLIVGIFASHGLSIITAYLFVVNMEEFIFVFSKSAFFKSILYFSIIYIVVIVFNIISLSKYRLINLLYANKKNESLKLKNIWISVILFIISIIFIVLSYYLIIQNGLLTVDNKLYGALIFIFVGTFLFFMSISGFLLKVIQLNKKLYFKNLNLFVLKQFNNKINTTFISITLICLMVTLALVAISSGLSISNALTKQLKQITPFDATMYSYSEDFDSSIENDLKNADLNLNDLCDEYSEITVYYSDLKVNDIYNIKSDIMLSVISLSDYNKILKMQNKQLIDLAKNEYAINADTNSKNTIKELVNNNKNINLNNTELMNLNNKFLFNTIENVPMRTEEITLIVQDKLAKNCMPRRKLLNLNFKEKNSFNKFNQPMEYVIEEASVLVATREAIYDIQKGISLIIVYLTIYIGIIFIIASTAVLALQQLSESADNSDRYKLLLKLGTEEKMLNKTLFNQISIYFITPLSLAIVHSIIGIIVINNIAKKYLRFLGLDLFWDIIITAILFIAVYGIYFITTYIASKKYCLK